MKDFSLTLLSNSSAELYGNTLSAFTNLLNSTIILDGDWEVGISHIFLNKLPYTERRKRDTPCEYFDQYNTELTKIKKLIDEYFKSIDEANKEDGKAKKKRSDTADLSDYVDNIATPMQHLTQKFMEQNLNEMLKHNNEIIDHAFVYTDIIHSQHIGDQSSRCLKVIPITNKRNYYSFNRIDYFPVQSNILRDISILITNGSGENINFDSSSLPTFCTLHFRKNI